MLLKWLLLGSSLALAGAAGFFTSSAAADESVGTSQTTLTITGEDGATTETVIDIRPETKTEIATVTAGASDAVTDTITQTDTVTVGQVLSETVTVEGDRGPRGFRGPRGPRGFRGATGATGAQGIPGPQMAPGDSCGIPGFVFQLVTVNTPGGQQVWAVCVQQ